MGIALLTLANVYQDLQGRIHQALRQPLMARPARRPAPWLRGIPGAAPHDPSGLFDAATRPLPQGQRAPTRSPALRVIHLSETAPSTRPGASGRWVISGRMADVCAELDRLAAFEADLEEKTTRATPRH